RGRRGRAPGGGGGGSSSGPPRPEPRGDDLALDRAGPGPWSPRRETPVFPGPPRLWADAVECHARATVARSVPQLARSAHSRGRVPADRARRRVAAREDERESAARAERALERDVPAHHAREAAGESEGPAGAARPPAL